MKKYFCILLVIFFVSCSRQSQIVPQENTLSQEQKMLQVQQLLSPWNAVDASIPETDSQSWKILGTFSGEITNKTQPASYPSLSKGGASGSLLLQKQSTWSSSSGTQTSSQNEPFTQEEIKIIENTSDTEINQLIDIIFKE